MTEWVQVPAGIVGIEGQRVPVGSFAIGRFPVTCEEYARFVDEGGYSEQSFWTDAGWAWRKRDGVQHPEFWGGAVLSRRTHPVVGVLWHEAIAYCNWLSTEEGSTIVLPSESQRQRAARGDEHLPYPWGHFFDRSLCNSAESGIGKTTPVDRYPLGRSPFGVFDMSGNVWEWCLNRWQPVIEGDRAQAYAEPPVLCGGSYFDVSLATLCEIRARYRSSQRLPYVGFRVVRNAS